MAHLQDIADYIRSLRNRHDRAFASDIVRLRARFGNVVVDRALELLRDGAARDRVSISGTRRRERERRAEQRPVAECHFRKQT
jgi:hypothetical protein